jgi:hypothetical protein
MKKTGYISAFLVLITAASVGSMELMPSAKSTDVGGQRANAEIAAMHAAIPPAAGGNVYEFSSTLTMPAAQKAQKVVLADGRVFEYY